MDDILKSAWGDLLNENEKLAALLDEKNARIEQLETALREICDFPYTGAQASAKIWRIARAALAGKSHT